MENLKLIIVVFSCVQIYCLIYAISMFAVKANCEYPSDSQAFGLIIWFLTRSIQYLIWVYPVMYIFWPRSLQRVIATKCKCCICKCCTPKEKRQ